MIKSFKDKKTKKIWNGEAVSQIPMKVQIAGRKKLREIAASGRLDDLRIRKSNRLEKLQPKQKGIYSIRIDKKWRICFKFKDGDANEVQITKHYGDN